MGTRFLGAGLFCLTLSTLLLETLDARLLSVLTWYHLSFLAISVAMLGMAAGAVWVFLDANRFSADRAPRALAGVTFLLACSIPVSHIFNLVIPFVPLTDFTVMEVLSVVASTIALTVPFVLSGAAVTLALTRCGGSIGRLYGLDLLGAASGCLVVVPLLARSNISSAVLFAGAAAALASYCFARFAGVRYGVKPLVATALLAGLAISNAGSDEFLKVVYPKNRQFWLAGARNALTAWNSHSYVLVQNPGEEPAFMWGAGRGGEQFRARVAWMAIDGEAGTPMTQWDGHPESLDWTTYDVTSLPYHLRRGDVAIIGVGGGRDILAALSARNPSIVGIEVNQIMIDLLTGPYREFTGIANRPEVTLVHDDGRAYITRATKNFDVIQMSLVDTWASTGAGAFTLSENALYTEEAWQQFIAHLKPGGVLSVSRWFDPKNVSEASRLVALGVGTLLGQGVAKPGEQIILVVRGRVATLMLSNRPFSSEDRDRLTTVARDKEFDVTVAPWLPSLGAGRLGRIARSVSADDLENAVYHPLYDYSPPTDRRPYYFNMLKPRAFFDTQSVPRGGALAGNLRATRMLLVLLLIASVLVILIIGWPLVRAGRPPMEWHRFSTTMGYFAIIGFAYMLVQIGLLQRLSVYLGHPTYALAIVLFSMLVFGGLGSLLSERVPLGRTGWFRGVPALVACGLVLTSLALPPTLSATVKAGLPGRTLVVLVFAAPLSMLLGMCFPFGVRLVRQTPAVLAWAWGVNGALGVLASIVAVGVSIWYQIDANFWLAACLYLGLTFPLLAMARWAASGASDSSFGQPEDVALGRK